MRKVFESLGILVNLGLGLFCLALAALGWIEGGDLTVPLVPVASENAAAALGIAGFYAVLSCVLAFRAGRWGRLPLLVWSLGLFLVLVAAVFRGDYRFDGIEAFRQHTLLLLGAAILLCTSYLRFRSPSRADALRHVTYGRHRPSR